MRLINVATLEFEEFYSRQVPEYAILSHTWGRDETTLQDFQSGRAPKKRGFDKIKYTCAQAVLHGLHWAWVDTCCIDKTNSTELSEAINSMFNYYTEAKYCYVYLEDVSPAEDESSEEEAVFLSCFENARWFRRGWTLQELIAPSCRFFFGAGWQLLGHVGLKPVYPYLCEGDQPVGRDLIKSVCAATGIPIECLDHGRQRPLSTFTVAVRMSWAAKRDCTRVEDIAYSLMGLFDVNMPLLYGEGSKAFIRLQEEIIRDIDDHTLLAWTVPPLSSENEGEYDYTPMGVLAPSPSFFAGVPTQLHSIRREANTLSQMTKHGLHIEVPLRNREYGPLSHLYVREPHLPGDPVLPRIVDAYLRCGRRDLESVVIRLLHVPREVAGRDNLYYRIGSSRLGFVDYRAGDSESVSSDPLQMNDSGLPELRQSDQTIYIAKKLLPMSALAEFDPWRTHFHYQTLPRPVVNSRGIFHPLAGTDADYRIPGWTSLTGSGPDAFMLQLPHPEAWLSGKGYASGIGFRLDVSYTTTHVGIWIRQNPYDDIETEFPEAERMKPLHESSFSEDYRDEKPELVSQDEFGHDRDECKIPRYGVVAQDETAVAGHLVTAKLWREDPRTEEGEAAGCRRHFLILVDIARLQPSDQVDMVS